ncbi:MAG TPA: RteC domain-containing protein [Chitinophagaceae bacterium]|nr:RteC domain-containing protein [Chitinophagaceae bacterium]
MASEEKNKISFWKKETGRLKKFYDDNISFIIYYNCKSHYDDSKFFLRKNNSIQSMRSIHAHDSDPEYFTSHDHLISSYLAHNMYAKYARKKLWELTGRYR